MLVSATPQTGMFVIVTHPIGVGHARPPWVRHVDVTRLQIELRGYWIRMGDTEKEAHSTDEHIPVALCRQIATEVVRYQRETRSQGSLTDFGSMRGVSQMRFDLRVIWPLLSGFNATAEKVTPLVQGPGAGKPCPNTACGAQSSSRSGAPGPEVWSFTGAPELPSM